MKKKFFCRCIINTSKIETAKKVFNSLLEVISTDNIEIMEFSEYWKNKEKFLCEFEFSLCGYDDSKIMEAYFVLLSKLSLSWSIQLKKNFSIIFFSISAIAEKLNIQGIDWINIESE